MNKIVVVLIMFFGTINVYSQGVYDILTMSQTRHGGTARFTSMGGAFTALGGDPSTLSQNPAGVGTFRRTDISITPFIPITGVSSEYMGIKTNDTKASFGISNGSVVFQFDTPKGVLKSINFGIAYNNQASFLEESNVRGGYTPFSRADVFAEQAYLTYQLENNRFSMADPAFLALNTKLIYWEKKNGGDDDSVAFYPANGYENPVMSSEKNRIRGSIGEYAFSLGANIDDMLYLGMTFGVQSINYSNLNYYSEIASPNGNSDPLNFSKYTLQTEYSYSGVGYNFKAGFIVRPFAKADFLTGLRLGGAVHTSTYVYLNDYYYQEMDTQLNNGSSMNDKLDPTETKFQVQTPYRFMVGAAYVLGNQYSVVKGTLSFDYEYSNYSSVEFFQNKDIANELFLNGQLKENLKNSTSNYRVGGELIFSNMALRAGYAFYDTPHTSDNQYKANVYSGGIGFSFGITYFDIGYSLVQKNASKNYDIGLIGYSANGEYSLDMPLPQVSLVNYRIFQHNIMFTIGMRF